MAVAKLDAFYMARAIELAQQGWYTTTPNPRVGCVMVGAEGVLSEGAHLKAGEGHAEANAIASAKQSLQGATAYVTLEPCSHTGRTGPCAHALIAAQVSRVVIGMMDPNPRVAGKGIEKLTAANIQVEVGVLEDECRALNPGFIKRMLTGLPRVTVKLAASLDGKTALANGKSQWITSAQARADVQRFRAGSCAILSSAETVLMDQARLTVRSEQLAVSVGEYGVKPLRQPDRIILDGRCRLTGDEPLFAEPEGVVIVRPFGAVSPHPQAQLLSLTYKPDGFDMHQLLEALGKREYNELWVEAGATLSGACIRAGLVDQLVLYLAPKLMGHQARDLFALPLMTDMNQVTELQFSSVELIGPDIRLIAAFN